jgi:hypothetical protein
MTQLQSNIAVENAEAAVQATKQLVARLGPVTCDLCEAVEEYRRQVSLCAEVPWQSVA